MHRTIAGYEAADAALLLGEMPPLWVICCAFAKRCKPSETWLRSARRVPCYPRPPLNRMDAIMLRYLFAALLITAMPAAAESIDCRVIGIADGNTFSCRTDEGERLRVRMAETYAPELKQPYGSQARQALSGYVFGKKVQLTIKGRDEQNRTLARVRAGDIDVNSQMVRTGSAWAYRGQLDDRTLLDLEAVAREFRRGIWSLHKTEQQPPWEWRKEPHSGMR